jgi:hypothetical protein
MSSQSASVLPGSVSVMRAPRERRRCHFAPSDDQKLCACVTRCELLDVIAEIIRETKYSRRAVIRHAKDLGVWNRFQIEETNNLCMARLLSNSGAQDDPLEVIATQLGISKTATRRRIYRDDDCVESLVGGTYSAREVAEGLCISRRSLSELIRSGTLRAKRLQRSGKLRISSDAILDFARTYTRKIPWSRCLAKSSWLQDILENGRHHEIAALLLISPKTLRSWIKRGILLLQFDRHDISAFFSDEPIYRLLDEYPDLVDLPKCATSNLKWFARYESVRGRHPQRQLPVEKVRTAEHERALSVRILLRRG